MTDERIAELLGWHHIDDADVDGLLGRIRLIVAEAQAAQSAQIERMRAALAYADGYIRHNGISRADALRMIDEAMGDDDDPR